MFALKNSLDQYYLGRDQWSDDAEDGEPRLYNDWATAARVMRTLFVPFAVQIVRWS